MKEGNDLRVRTVVTILYKTLRVLFCDFTICPVSKTNEEQLASDNVSSFLTLANVTSLAKNKQVCQTRRILNASNFTVFIHKVSQEDTESSHTLF